MDDAAAARSAHALLASVEPDAPRIGEAGDLALVGQVVPSARELALQAEDESIQASAERAKAARAAKQQAQAEESGADPETGELGDDSGDGAAGAGDADPAGADAGDDEDVRWRIVDEILAELKSKTTVMEFNSAHSRRKHDIEALSDEQQAEIGKEIAKIMLALKGGAK